MNLTPDQVAAAKAVGCAFFPATEMQVQRLTMQQRVFRVDGKPFLLSRDGSYYETAGTLRALIATVLTEPPEPSAAAPTPIPAEAAEAAETPRAADPAPEPASPEAALSEPPPPAAPRRRGRPRKVSAPAATVQVEPEPAPEPAPEPPPAEHSPPAALEPPAPDTGGRGDRLARLARRRAGAPLPKWRTAGPARRGRLKRS